MRNQTDTGEKVKDNERITKIGKFLRSSSFDEIPQLINIILGDMSFVGPRPLPTKYLTRYSSYQNQRHKVKPGITGWAQVNGRNSISWDEKFEMDIYYVENRSFFLDFRILLMTAKKVLLRRDINASRVETMPEFMGSNKE